MIDQENFSKDLREKIASDLKILDSNVRSTVMTIFMIFLPIFSLQEKKSLLTLSFHFFPIKKAFEKAFEHFQKSVFFAMYLMHSYLNSKFLKL